MSFTLATVVVQSQCAVHGARILDTLRSLPYRSLVSTLLTLKARKQIENAVKISTFQCQPPFM